MPSPSIPLSGNLIVKAKDYMKITEKIKNWSLTWRTYPICVFGYDIRRWENAGYEFWYNAYVKKFLFMKSMTEKGPTHLQYKSPFGFLVQWPLCFHIWYQFRPQAVVGGNRVPGTEKVFYFRVGIARWESGSDTYILGQPFKYFNLGFGTWYGPGLKWD